MIQNGDDAGATEVKFLYDNRYYDTDSLPSPEFANFQGPALYCFNNATFKEEDWEGIQNIMRSNKKDNPLKVGRFGIGFNSVYHITGELTALKTAGEIGFGYEAIAYLLGDRPLCGAGSDKSLQNSQSRSHSQEISDWYS